MKVNDYIRTKKGIAKIIDRINDPTNYYDKFWACDRYLELNDDTEYIHEQDVIKCSPNIIDLIEVGDYVNGLKVIQMYSPEGKYTLWIKLSDNTFIDNSKDIKSIVTREQFSQMEYKVKE
jgi:hypothetical protein